MSRTWRNAGRISNLIVTPSIVTGAHFIAYAYYRIAGRRRGRERGHFIWQRGTLPVTCSAPLFLFHGSSYGAAAYFSALFSCRSSFQAFFHFAFLYFNQAISIAMAPLGMIMKLVEPVRLGTSMNRMLMTSSGQMAVPMFFR